MTKFHIATKNIAKVLYKQNIYQLINLQIFL